MAGGTKFTTRDIHGRKVDLFVHGDGTFTANVDENEFTAATVDSLVAQLMTALKVKVEIPFHRWVEGKLQLGVCKGRHASNRNYLVKLGGKKNEQEYHYGSDLGMYLRLTAEEQAEYSKLKVAEELAIRASILYEKAHAIDMREEINALMGKED